MTNCASQSYFYFRGPLSSDTRCDEPVALDPVPPADFSGHTPRDFAAALCSVLPSRIIPRTLSASPAMIMSRIGDECRRA